MKNVEKLLREFYLKLETVNRYLSELERRKQELGQKIFALQDMSEEEENNRQITEKLAKEYKELEKLQEAIGRARDLELQKLVEEIGEEFSEYISRYYNEMEEGVLDLLEKKLAYLASLYEFRQRFDNLDQLSKEIESVYKQLGLSFTRIPVPGVSDFQTTAQSQGERTAFQIFEKEIDDIFFKGEIDKYPQVHAYYRTGKVFRTNQDAFDYLHRKGERGAEWEE
jgi:DNA repair exonuclease SbcCD ATPase subunit